VVIMSTFCDGFMVQYVNAGQISAFVILLFDCFVCHQNVTCLKRFTRWGGRHNHSQNCNCFL